jgi:hypothetical protein
MSFTGVPWFIRMLNKQLRGSKILFSKEQQKNRRFLMGIDAKNEKQQSTN